jgi:acetyl-CoA C-acetyltransferase
VPATVSATAINKVCGSGLKAAMMSAQAIRAGDAELFIAGGMESMSRAPYLVSGRMGELKFGNQQMTDALLNDGLWDPFENWGMGMAAEFIADEYEVTRAAMDEFALRSHLKAVEAQEAGRFNAEIVPVQIPGRKGEVTILTRRRSTQRSTSSKDLPN